MAALSPRLVPLPSSPVPQEPVALLAVEEEAVQDDTSASSLESQEQELVALAEQGHKLDLVTALDTLPSALALNSSPTLQDLLLRALRRSIHAKHEHVLLKHIAAAENMRVVELFGEKVKAMEGVVQLTPLPAPPLPEKMDEKVGKQG